MKTKLSEEELLQLTPEELYEEMEYLAETTVHRLFPQPKKYANTLHMDLEDFYQFGKMGLWKGINTFRTATHNRSLKSFLIQNIRWSIHYHIWRSNVQDRIYKSKDATDDNLATVISMSNSPQYDDENTNTFYDFVAVDNINNFDSTEEYPENIVISQFDIEDMMSVLNDNEKELVKLRIGNSDLTYKEIAAIYGVTKQCIGMKFKKIQSKIRDYLNKEAVAI